MVHSAEEVLACLLITFIYTERKLFPLLGECISSQPEGSTSMGPTTDDLGLTLWGFIWGGGSPKLLTGSWRKKTASMGRGHPPWVSCGSGRGKSQSAGKYASTNWEQKGRTISRVRWKDQSHTSCLCIKCEAVVKVWLAKLSIKTGGGGETVSMASKWIKHFCTNASEGRLFTQCILFVQPIAEQECVQHPAIAQTARDSWPAHVHVCDFCTGTKIVPNLASSLEKTTVTGKLKEIPFYISDKLQNEMRPAT